MKYKDILGYDKNKKVTKKVSKPKVNEVLNSIKKEFGYKQELKEVGAGDEYLPHIHKIDKSYHDYWDAVKDFTDLLHKKGLKKEGNKFHRMYMNMVAKYHTWFVKNIRKLF
tara:strand:- start:395 stop:727 length:333 start_codon:yes stop_codon:yes gene_type:complete